MNCPRSIYGTAGERRTQGPLRIHSQHCKVACPAQEACCAFRPGNPTFLSDFLSLIKKWHSHLSITPSILYQPKPPRKKAKPAAAEEEIEPTETVEHESSVSQPQQEASAPVTDADDVFVVKDGTAPQRKATKGPSKKRTTEDRLSIIHSSTEQGLCSEHCAKRHTRS